MRAWVKGADPHHGAPLWKNIFAAAIRHMMFDGRPVSIGKGEARALALERLREWSSRDWPADDEE